MSIPVVGVGLQGFYKLEAVRPDGQRRVLADWFPNLILNNGLNILGTTGPINRAVVGTGSSAPAVTQTQLDSITASSINSATNLISFLSGSFTTGPVENHFGWINWVFRFSTGLATGNLTEVGVGNGDFSLFSRALILDTNGNPTTITVLSDESLDVSYQLRVFANLNDVNANIVINGVTYATVLRPSNFPMGWANAGYSSLGAAGSFSSTTPAYGSGALGGVGEVPGGNFIANGTFATIGSYVNNSYNRDIRYTWGIGGADLDFFNIDLPHGFGRHKVSFNPGIPKRNTNILTLDMRLSWTRRV